MSIQDTTFQPHRWQHTANLPLRGDGRGLGKPVYRNGKRIGQNYMLWVHGKPSLVQYRITEQP